jgi:polysaccharide deacetylase family protein (PEP-CTERM system associated)
MPEVRHHCTIDVEEYFQVSALEPHVPRSQWDAMESRLVEGMGRLMDVMAETDTRGTFFVLGIVAEKHPDMVRELSAAGHEIASHGWDHRRVWDLSPDEFRSQARKSRACLEEISGKPVLGYRAPSFSIVRGGEWALEILVEEGYRYDSSLYPVRRPGYGYRGGSRCVHTLELSAGPLVEVPPATFRIAGANFPAGGGGTFRHLPYRFTRAAFRQHQSGADRAPATFYLHPWELDPDQPRVPGLSWLTRMRHYGGLERTEGRLRRLLKHFRFQPIADTLATMNGR